MNAREHWAAKARRVANERYVVRLILGYRRDLPLPLVVKLTRLGPQKMDGDNLQGSQKHIRDQVAEWLGVDDGDEQVTWQYAQERAAVISTRLEVFAMRGVS